ncbi:MAG: DNA topoisomerase (ATP-hydrolyzing) [Candidatus Absconditabacterales bacterium]
MANQEDLFTPVDRNVIDQPIESEISQSYIDYAMSVIVSRALPDTRDGMKPVIRRILYTMQEMGLYHNTRYKKSMGVVGQVLRDYHPHGDTSVYEAMVRLTQDFSLRYPLVDGQGNFGSIDGDGAAAARYTEVRMSKIAEFMLENINEDTVDWRPNYDNSREEPKVLPTRFPNHLCNGTMGIAVGMATNMAPHNLVEVIDACNLLINNPQASIEEIMEIVKGPDFPTGGIIFDTENIKQIYTKGKGSILMRAKTHIETAKNGSYIIIDEVPYQVTKAGIVEKIGELVAERKIEGITDIVDESAKNNIRVSIEIKKGFDPQQILVQLYKYTNLQTTFSINNVTLVEDGLQPKVLNIKDLLQEFIDFRRVVVLRRSKFQLAKAEDRLHILEGLHRAIDIIDEIIALIRSSQTTDEAKQQLMTKFDFTEVQAEYILKLTLGRLVGLEIQKILEEIGDKQALIAELTQIINDPAKLNEVVVKEINEVKDKFGDARKTDVSNDVGDMAGDFKKLLKLQDLKKEDVICLVDNESKIKLLYQSRIMNIPEETAHMIYTNNQDKLIVITDIGELVIARLKDLPSHTTKSEPLDPVKHWSLKGKIVLCETMEDDYQCLSMITNKNSLKKIKKDLLLGFKKFPTVIMNLEEGEHIINITPTNEGDAIGIISTDGNMVLFKEENLRPMGKTSGGVKGIELKDDDQVAGMFRYRNEEFILVYSNNAAKLLNIDDLKFHRRGHRGQVIATLKLTEKMLGALPIDEGNIRIKLDNDELKTLHNDTMKLDEPDATLEQITNNKIVMVYRPREEREKKQEKQEPQG